MKSGLVSFFMCMFVLSLTGCAAVHSGYNAPEKFDNSQTVEQYLKVNVDLSEEIMKCMNESRVCVGMNREQVEATWGNPKRIADEDARSWVFVYCRETSGPDYVGFKDGKVSYIGNSIEYEFRKQQQLFEQYFLAHPDRVKFQADVKEQRIQLGMTKDEVKLITGGFHSSSGAMGNNVEWWLTRKNIALKFENDTLVKTVGIDSVVWEQLCRVERYLIEHPNRTDFKKVLMDKEIVIGMTQEEVEMSWGKPGDINRTVGAWGVHEQWIYGSYSYGKTNLLYFENGVLTSWQD